MRLTLRTLLAYLDGILEPNDAEDLAKKIEESDYAVELVDRIRDVMRRLRLGAPSISDRGPGLDPNTVAEYLDNTLASERVSDFEKVCLDSDIHLAEVASSHQILTLVLGEPAEVDPASRQRMYLLHGTEGKVKPPPTSAVQSTPAMPGAKNPPRLDLEPSAAGERKPRPKPTVPEYLREPRRRAPWLAISAAVLLAACFTVVVLMAFGFFEPEGAGGKLLARLGVTSAQQPEAASKAEEVKGQEQTPKASTPDKSTAAPTVEPGKEPAPSTTANEKPEVKNPPPSAPPSPPATAETPPSATPPNGATKPAVPESAPKASTETNPPAPGPTSETEKPAAPEVVEQPQQLPPEPLGRLMSGNQVLLGSKAGGDWTRVAPNQMLIPQDVMALPTYRVKIALTMGVTLEILGGSRVELLGGSAGELPGIRVLYGRVVLMPLGKVGSRMRLAFGERSGTITFTNAETVVALDVHRLRVPGTNPETGPARIVADLYVTTGGITWEESAGGTAAQPIALAPQQRLNFDANLTSAPTDARELPPWIEGSTISPLDRRASVAIAEALPTDRLTRVSLMELEVSRPQKEVKWLALRCLGYLGQFDDVVLALNNEANKLVWSDYIDELRAAVGRDAESAAAVRLALEKQFPQQAADLYRMLWGYTNQDLQNGNPPSDRTLVAGLDDDLLAMRVLSYWNLRDITGQGAAYQPEQPAARRAQAVRRWRQRLEAKEIRYADEPKAGERKAPEKKLPEKKGPERKGPEKPVAPLPPDNQ